ncbi:hypothetical protein UFOVP891_22 [uncultured Caudovirales phage]|uniref:DUF559 domain-containing protein n=1 Tax=uncultured Caudovirales phage TaxID=2100421 RepID=A0A6J5QEJ1_9CAUD|nr:hypothetical protein UFOVP472_46 [uncultured Caudovirales phage]CAB4169022.1 hypothetical protein UFOVP891_22 [uncultured Caudovirales phage]CAB4180786.1 hypothetical protein UFOVP1053_46 [uncultured Caudovirales phage]CAB4195671.1 hypothetical protein UFOVP1297_28 [uncultured Caudovirales phage]CAB4221870.1 hypothetical protein UFOVP1647_6 [uncultured Caudovirales phage]
MIRFTEKQLLDRAKRLKVATAVLKNKRIKDAVVVKKSRSKTSSGEQLFADQLRDTKIFGWQCEYQFHCTRRWRLDFAWPEKLIAVEIEGGIWTNGRHTRGAGFEADCEKYAELSIAGWRLIRVSPGQINSGQALDWVRRALA